MTPVRLALLPALMLAFLGAAPAWALLSAPTAAVPSVDVPTLPQKALLTASLQAVYQNREDIDQALVVVELGLGRDNPQWLMSATQREILLDTLLQFMPDAPVAEDTIWPKLKRLDPKYKGIRIVLRTVWGQNIAPLRIFEGKVVDEHGNVLVPDYGRRMEYWLFGTSRVRRDQLIGASVLPVITFEQCRLLGQQIIYTRPRQCLLPDNNLLLETSEPPSLASAKIANFDECLMKGKALIYTFPRRCVAAGGRVFTEPPRVYDTPKADGVSVPLVAKDGMSLPETDANGLLVKPMGAPMPMMATPLPEAN